MDSGQLSANLLKWLATFQAGANVIQPEDISDGVIIATVLHEIEPVWFDDAWLSKIKTDAGDNWRLKVSNLKKVTQGINDYLSESLELNISHLKQPDVNKLGETASGEEAGRLLQLVLGVAVNCSRKQEYIESIQELEPAVQAALMAAIQELMARGGPGGAGGGPLSSSAGSLLYGDPLPALASELELVKDERHQIQQRCYELDNQIALLLDEKSVLQAENQKLQKRLQLQQELPDAGEEGESPEQRQRYKQIIQKLAANNEEIYKLEATREELRVRCELMEKDLRETQAKNEELQRLADETRRLRDELEILRDLTAKVPQYEAKLDSYQKRLQEMGDLRRQLKLLEEKNTDYMQQNMDLQAELKRTGSYRPQLDLYKKQVGELHEQLSEETKKRDKADFELRKLGERMAALQNEKERLVEERDKLREANEELKLAQLQPGVVGRPLGSRLVDGAEGRLTEPQLDATPADLKEKLLRLQHENRQLRSQVAGADRADPETAYGDMLEDLRGRETALQAENRWASDTQLLARRPRPATPPSAAPAPPPPAPPPPAAPDQVTIRHIHEIKLCTSPEPAADSGVRLTPNALLREYVDQLVSSASTPQRHSPIVCGVIPDLAGLSLSGHGEYGGHSDGHESSPLRRQMPEHTGGHGRQSGCEHDAVQPSPSAAYTEEYIRKLQDMATSTTELLLSAPALPPPRTADDACSLVSCDDAVSVASSRGPQRFTRQGSVKYKQERWPGAQRQRSLKVSARKEDSVDSGCGCSSRRTTLDARRLDVECASGTTTMTGVTERSDGYLERRMSFIGRYDGGSSLAAASDVSGSLLDDEPLYLTLTTPSKDSAVDSRATPSLASAEEFHPDVFRPLLTATARLDPLAERSPPRDDGPPPPEDQRRTGEPAIVRWRSRSLRRIRRSRSRSKSKNRRSRLLDTVGVLGATFAMCAP